MMRLLKGFILPAAIVFFWDLPVSARDPVAIPVTRDNTIYSESGGKSNGAGEHLFSGMTRATLLRRALVYFDLKGSVPDGSVIDSVRLEMLVDKGQFLNPVIVGVHSLKGSWGEAGSDAELEEGQGATADIGDATWTHAFYDTLEWNNPGGDFEPAASAEAGIGGFGPVSWGGTGLKADVDSWLEDPSANFGWILIGDEENAGASVRYASGQNAAAGDRPVLRIWYSDVTAAVPGISPGESTRLSVHPNPFTSGLGISYEIEVPTRVELSVYNILGQQVMQLMSGESADGKQEVNWDGRDAAGTEVREGLYYLILRTEHQQYVAKVLKSN